MVHSWHTVPKPVCRRGLWGVGWGGSRDSFNERASALPRDLISRVTWGAWMQAAVHTAQKGPCLSFTYGLPGIRVYLVVVRRPFSPSYTPEVILLAWMPYHSGSILMLRPDSNPQPYREHTA